MSGKVFGRVVRLTAILSTAATLGAAHAAKYTGTWDPAYGDPFTSIGWRGQATFEFEGSCLWTFTNSCTGSGVANVLEATVEFYDTSVVGDGFTDATAPAVAWLSWTATNPIKSATFDGGGNLTAVVTQYLQGGQAVTLTEAGELSLLPAVDDLTDYLFYLEFLGDRAQLTHLRYMGPSPTPPTPECANSDKGQGQSSTRSRGNGGGPDCGYSDPDTGADAGTFMRFAAVNGGPNPVPEPTTYALVLAGLAAAGLINRKRRGR